MDRDFNYDYEDYSRYKDSGDMPEDDSQYDPEVLERIRLAKLRRERADQLARDRLHAEMILVGGALMIILIIVSLILKAGSRKEPEGTYLGESAAAENVTESAAEETQQIADTGSDSSEAEKSGDYAGQAEGHQLVTQNGITYVDGIMIVNKTFSLPSDYNPGLDSEANDAFYEMAAQAWSEGITLWICSGYRTYDEQETLFAQYASERGLDEADSVSARPGHSEHQTGLCMDINSTDFSFGSTDEAAWLAENCADYGFIIRFPEGKESITGYEYEPWHIRYVGVEAAQEMKATGQCLEEYLNVTSDYADSPDNDTFIEKYSQYSGSADASSESEDTDYSYDYNNDNNDVYYDDRYNQQY
jgi:D-alanyl-D-alanine carboxypeptidase